MQGQAKNGTASNRDNVFEGGFTLAAGILDALKPDWAKNYNSAGGKTRHAESRPHGRSRSLSIDFSTLI